MWRAAFVITSRVIRCCEDLRLFIHITYYPLSDNEDYIIIGTY
jgi:hypothetical protein